jgi:general stress protein 26
MNYFEIEKTIINLLDNTEFCVLATSNNLGVIDTATMCLVNDKLTVYFQTDNKYEKVRNIKENNNVTINIGAYSFKGTELILNHPNNYDFFVEQMKRRHKSSYEKYTNLYDEVLIKVEIKQSKIWKVNNNSCFIVHVDIINKTVDEINKTML